MTAPDLLPCPFCGENPDFITGNLGEKFAYAEKYTAFCNECSFGISRMDDQNPKGGYALDGTGLPKLVAVWNQRDTGVSADVVDELVQALGLMVYETTHLSPEESDGSHWCKISKEALEAARAALARYRGGA